MSDRPTLLVDSREQRPLQFSDAVDVEVCALSAGDYSIAGFTEVITVERKASGDLWQCCGSERERFEAELQRLRAWPLRAVVIEATIDRVLGTQPRGRIKPATVIHSTIGWQADFGIPFVWCGSPRNAAAWVERALTRVARKAKAAA